MNVTEQHEKRLDDHEGRLRILEKALWKSYGAVILASAIGSMVVKWLPNFGGQ